MGSPMPRDLTEDAVAEWLFNASQEADPGETWDDIVKDDEPTRGVVLRVTRAVLALVEAKVREGVDAASNRREIEVPLTKHSFRLRDETDDEIVARVMGEDGSKRGSDEGRQARGEVTNG